MKKDKEAKKKKKEKSAQVSVPETVKTVSPETEDAILETLLKHIGGKWKIRIIWALQDAQSKRYSTLKNEVSSITDMMLSQSLKELMASGIVEVINTKRFLQE
ncbi:MAG: winged helix-turn-helix transcriptional regulator [Acutalibacteraceae bacterium]